MDNWVNSIVFQYESITVTHLTVIRTLLIVFITWGAVKLSKIFWVRVEQAHDNFNHSHLYVISRVSKVFIILIGIAVAFEYLGVDFTNLTLIASALSVGIGFGLQDTVRNVIAGIVILTERSLRIGDWISTETSTGFIKQINIRSTVIQTWDRTEVIVPNSDLVKTPVTNWTLSKSTGRITLNIGVAYGSDIEIIENTLLEIATADERIVTDGSEPEPLVLFIGFAESCMQFELRCFVNNVIDRLVIMSDLYKAVYLKFSDLGIKIPFPQRDLHIYNNNISTDHINTLPPS